MARNLVSISIDSPSSPQTITSVPDSFTLLWTPVMSGGGGANNWDYAVEWDQGTASWTTIPASGTVYYSNGTVSEASVAYETQQSIDINIASGAPSSFNIRIHNVSRSIDSGTLAVTVDLGTDVTATKLSPTLSVKSATVQADVDTNISASKVALSLALNAPDKAGLKAVWVNSSQSKTSAVAQPTSSWTDTSITISTLTQGALGTGTMYVAVETPDFVGGPLSNWYSFTATSAGTYIDATKVALSLTGYDATINAENNLAPNKLAVTLTGYDATINAKNEVDATKQAVSLTGYTASVNAKNEVAAQKVALSLTKYNTTTKLSANITPGLLNVTLAGYAASVNAKNEVDATKVALSLTGYAATTSLGINIDATKVALSLTKYNTTTKLSPSIDATKQAVTLTGYTATVQANVDTDVTATKPALSLTKYTATVQANVDTDVTATKQAVTLTGYTATVQANVDTDIDATKVALSLAGYAAVSKLSKHITAAKVALSLAGYSASVNAKNEVDALKVALSLTGYAAQVSAGDDTNVNANKISLSLTKYGATVQADVDTNIDATKLSPTLAVYGATVQANVDTDVTATKLSPTIATYAASVNAETNITAEKVVLSLQDKFATIAYGTVVKKVYVNSTPSLSGAVEQPYTEWLDTSVTLGALTQGALGTGTMYVALEYDGNLGNWYQFNATDTLVANKTSLSMAGYKAAVGRHFGPDTLNLTITLPQTNTGWHVYAATTLSVTLTGYDATVVYSEHFQFDPATLNVGLSTYTAGVSLIGTEITASKVSLAPVVYPAAFDDRDVFVNSTASISGAVRQPWTDWGDTSVTLGALTKGGLTGPNMFIAARDTNGNLGNWYPFQAWDWLIEPGTLSLSVHHWGAITDLTVVMIAMVETFVYPAGQTYEVVRLDAAKTGLSLSPKSAVVRMSLAVAATLVSFSLAAKTADTALGLSIDATKTSLSTILRPATIELNANPTEIDATKVSLDAGLHIASVELGTEIQIGAARQRLSFVTYPATVSYTMQLTAGKSSLSITNYGGAFSWPVQIQAQTGEVDVYGHQPSLPPNLGAGDIQWDGDNKRWGGVDISYAEFVPVYPLRNLFFAAGQGSGFPAYRTEEVESGTTENWTFISIDNTGTSGTNINANRVTLDEWGSNNYGWISIEAPYQYPVYGFGRPVNIARIWDDRWAMCFQVYNTNTSAWYRPCAWFVNFRDGTKAAKPYEKKFDSGSNMTWDIVGSGPNRGLTLSSWLPGTNEHLYPAYGAEFYDSTYSAGDSLGTGTAFATMYFQAIPEVESGIWLHYKGDSTQGLGYDEDDPKGWWVRVYNNASQTGATFKVTIFDDADVDPTQTVDLETLHPTWAAKIRQGQQVTIWARVQGDTIYAGLWDWATDTSVTLVTYATTETWTTHAALAFGHYPIGGSSANVKTATVRLLFIGHVNKTLGGSNFSVPTDIFTKSGNNFSVSKVGLPDNAWENELSNPWGEAGTWTPNDFWDDTTTPKKWQPDMYAFGSSAYSPTTGVYVVGGTYTGMVPVSSRREGFPAFYTADRGASWYGCTGPSLTTTENDAVYSQKPLIQYMSLHDKFLMMFSKKLFYSADGITWTEATGITWQGTPPTTFSYASQFEETDNDQLLIVVNRGTTGQKNLLRSTDGGVNWSEVNLSALGDDLLRWILFNRVDSVLVGAFTNFVGGVQFYTRISTDGGTSWSEPGNNIYDIPLEGSPPPNYYFLRTSYKPMAYHTQYYVSAESPGAYIFVPPTNFSPVALKSKDGLNWVWGYQSTSVNSASQDQWTEWLEGSNYAATTSRTYYTQESYEVVLERIGITFDKTDRFGNPKVDPMDIKLVRGIWPVFDGLDGQVVRCYIGSQMAPNDPIEWSGPRDFIIGDDYYIDFRVSGRYISLRFEADVSDPFVLLGYDLDVEPVGRR